MYLSYVITYALNAERQLWIGERLMQRPTIFSVGLDLLAANSAGSAPKTVRHTGSEEVLSFFFFLLGLLVGERFGGYSPT